MHYRRAGRAEAAKGARLLSWINAALRFRRQALDI